MNILSLISKYYIFKKNISNDGVENQKTAPLYIICTGPSLREVDMSLLRGQHTMSFNRSYIAYKDWGFEPTYYAALDHVVNQDNKDDIRQLIEQSNIKRFFFSRDNTSSRHFTSSKTTLIEVESDPQNPNLEFKSRLKVGNTGLFGLQIAIGILKYTKIYLLGCDASYQEKIPGIQQSKEGIISQTNEDLNHFRLDYYGKGKTYNIPKAYIYHYPAWKSFYENYLVNQETIKVFNCSRTSKLDFLPYKDFRKTININNIRTNYE